MLNGAKVPEAEKKHVFNECLNTVTQVDGLIVRKVNGKTATRYEHWCSTLPKFARHLREWGEAGVVTVRDIKTNKLTNKGRLCMFVGYATKHAGDCYCMYDPNTKRILISRDVRWFNRLYYGTAEQKTNVKEKEKKVRF